MNLYIINDVLYDYTDGMCVIAAESMSHCESIFMEKFGYSGDNDYSVKMNEQMQRDFNDAPIKVIEGINHPAGVVSYVYGGG